MAMSQVKTSTKPSGDTNKILCNQNDAFQMWGLTKVENGNELNMIKKYGTKYYWCDNHKHPDCEQSGMYVFYKPTEHDAWKKKKDEFNARKKGRGKSTPTDKKTPDGSPSTTPAAVLTASTSKLSSAKSLQEALTTMTRLSEDQFNKIWESACSA
jgi:hypothetical protein